MTKEFLSKGRQRYLMLVSLLLLAVATFAVPAKPGLTRLLTLIDGTTVNATLVGDEYLHYWLGADGNAYQAVGENTYQRFDPQAAQESADERRFSANQQRSRRLAPRKVGNVGSITGQKKGLIILVNFSDVTFNSANNNALYQRIANERNFTYAINSNYSFKGSMRDYFYAQSEGQFELTFDVVGPVTLSKKQAYYGANDNEGNDQHPAEMVIEALNLADPEVNYSDYVWTENGTTVEQVYVVYAGKGEADGGAANTIWPHEWTLSSAKYYGDGSGPQTLDGVKIDTYACGGELNGQTGLIAGIGTMCHEFSHCLGYPDFYDTDYSGGQGMGYWDLMDSGSYNDDGYQPAGYTSYERMVAGWKTPEELVYTQNISNMAALQDEGSKSYIIYNKGHRDEYYLLENRQMKKWDTSLPGAGLLILHVDYNSSAWSNNTVNNTLNHQRMTWIPADNQYQYTTYQGTKYYTFEGMANDPFPYGSVNAFGKNTTPAATLYNNNSDGTKYLDSSIENITQNSDGTISFYFHGLSNVALPNISPDGDRFAMDQTVTVTINAEAGATIYYTTDGSTPTTSSTQYTAPFTVTATTTVKAIAVKNGESSGVASATYTFVEPFITADENLTFSTNVGTPETKTLTVLTEGLTQDVTLMLTDANNVFSLGTNTISKSLEDATVNVTFSPTAAGNYSGTITLTSEGADPVTVSLSATASIPVPTAPTGLALSEVTSNSLTASWSAVDNATSYEIDVVEGISFEPSAGGTVLASDFSDTSDWTLSGTGTYTNSPYIGSSSPSIKFDGTNDYAISPDFGSGVKLQFWAYGNGGSGSTFAISGLVNDTWTDIETVTIADGGATYEVNLPDGTSQVRFDFTKSVNCALDDVKVYGPGNSMTSVDGYPKSVGNVTSYAVTGLTSGTQYAVRVRAVNDSGNSDWSTTATTTTAIANSAPVWSLPTNASVIVGNDYELTISDYVSGTPTPTISMTASDSNDADYDDGYFLFIPTETGTFNFTFTATNSEGSAEATLTVTVSAASSGGDPNPSGNEFALVTSASDFGEGDYIIVYDGVAMNTTISNNRLQYAAVTPTNNVITTDDATIIWHIAPSGEYYTIYNAGANKYAAATGSNNQAQLLSDGTDDKSLWSLTTRETFDFVNKSNSRYLRRNGTYGFACYETGTGGALSLYKRTSGGGTDPVGPSLAYYQNADGKQGQELKTAMCSIIYSRTELGYDDLWTAFQTTDVRSDNKIWDMYSNITNYTPVTSGSTYSQEGDCYNREHSWPQSWFGSNTPMYTDLHHIYPTDGFVNGKRANYPFGETNGEDYKSANDFSKLGDCTYPGYTGTVFEPADEYKGDFARTYFYMVTCYEEKLADWYTNYGSTDVVNVIDGSTYPGFQSWQLNMLMEWAKDDPVSEKETVRNNAVYAIQNNRNPFIDYPGLEEYIWGSMTTTAFSYDNYVQPTNAVTVPTLAIDNITSNGADASWTACDGVTDYTLQLASDNEFTTGSAGSQVTLFSNDGTDATSSPAGWTYNVSDNTSAYLLLFSGHYVVSEAVDASACTDLSVSLYIRTYGGTSQPNLAIQYSTDNGSTWTDAGTVAAANSTMTQRTLTLPAAAASSALRLRFAPTTTSTSVGVGIKTIELTGTESASGTLIATETVNGTSHTFSGLTSGTTYYARVKGNGDWSDVVSFTTQSAGPSAPVLTVPQDSYSVLVGAPDISFTVTATGTPAPTVTATCTEGAYYVFEDNEFRFELDTKGTYHFVFTATNSEGSDSKTVTVNVSGAAPSISVPQTSYEVTVGSPEVNFHVNATGAPEPTVTATCTEGAYFLFENNEFRFDPDTEGTYHFVFTATNSEGSDSETVTIVVSAAPVTVPELTVDNVTSNSADASWTACDGVTEYTLQLASDNEFTASSTGGNVTLLTESFTDATGTSSTACSDFDAITDNDGWEGSYVYASEGTVRISSSSHTGDIESPKLTTSIPRTTVTLQFDAKSWTNANTTVNVTVTEDGATYSDPISFTLTEKMDTYTTSFTVYGTQFRVRFAPSAANKRFYLDNVIISYNSEPVEGSIIATETVSETSHTFTGLVPGTTYYARVKGNKDWSDVVEFTTDNATLSLADNSDNSEAIDAAATSGDKYDVTLNNRTLYKDGYWNTLCLPFSLSAEQIAACDLAGADIRTLSTASFSEGTLTLNFTPETGEGTVTEITAGTPYIIKWSNSNSTIENPVFSGVTIDKTVHEKICDLGNDNSISFCGTYDMLTYNDDDPTILFLGNENNLYYPQSCARIGAQRAYFKLTGIKAKPSASGDNGNNSLVRAFELNFGDDNGSAGIVDPEANSSLPYSLSEWYDLNGRRLNGKPTAKGIYVNGNRKVVIK